MARFHSMADGTVRPCEGCSRCTGAQVMPRRPVLSQSLRDEAYRVNQRLLDIAEGTHWAATHTGVAPLPLSDALGVSVAMRDAGRRPSVPMPALVRVIRLDVDRKGNALKPEKARSKARTAGTSSLPEARYNGLPRGSNHDPNWTRRWAKKGVFTLPTTTPSSRLVPQRLHETAALMDPRRSV